MAVARSVAAVSAILLALPVIRSAQSLDFAPGSISAVKGAQELAARRLFRDCDPVSIDAASVAVGMDEAESAVIQLGMRQLAQSKRMSYTPSAGSC